jgi:hypothetical protein
VSAKRSLPATSYADTIRRRARRSVLVALVAFVVLQLVTAIVLESGPDRDPIYSVRLSRLRKQQRAAGEKPITVVMLGSSRTECALRSAELHDLLTRSLGRPVAVGNFGLSGCGTMMQLLTWNRLGHDGVRPDLVLVEAMPAMLSENWAGNDLSEERLPLARVRSCDLDVFERDFPEVRPGLRREWMWAWPNPLFTQRLNLVGRCVPNLLPVNQRQWLSELAEDEPATQEPLPPERRQRALENARKEYAANLQHFQLGGRSYECLRTLLTRIRSEGVPAALVILPEGPEFQSWYAPGAYQTVREALHELAAELGFAVLDLHDGLEETDFIDSHHLTPGSAARVTERLGKEHLVPLLQQLVAGTNR